MNKKLFRTFIISICSIFILTFCIIGFLLFSEYKVGVEAAENKFKKLIEGTNSAISKTVYPNTEFIKLFTQEIGSLEHYKSLYLKSETHDIYNFSQQNSQLSDIFTITKSSSIYNSQKINLTLTVSIYAITPEIMYSKFKIAFLIILATTLLSALLLIYIYLSSEKNTSYKKNYESEIDFNDESDFLIEKDYQEDSNYINDDNDIDLYSENKYDEDYDNQNHIETISEALNYDLSEFDNDSENKNEEFSIPEIEDINFSNNLDSPTSAQNNFDEENNQNNYFNNQTGLCREDILVTRLESELSRASSSELELSIILIKIPAINLSSECGIEICKSILDIFHYRDMMFEYKTDGIAIIYSNANIDKSIETSEQIYAQICAILSRYEILSKPLFGIASRSLRFISGDRLIVEAEQALIHAKDEPENPIIAFRVNPEKYRKYMAAKSNN